VKTFLDISALEESDRVHSRRLDQIRGCLTHRVQHVANPIREQITESLHLFGRILMQSTAVLSPQSSMTANGMSDIKQHGTTADQHASLDLECQGEVGSLELGQRTDYRVTPSLWSHPHAVDRGSLPSVVYDTVVVPRHFRS
jgi:hypothetical protein